VCDAPAAGGAARESDAGDWQPAGPPVLDLVAESCPLNLLRARREVEALPPGSILEIHLGSEGAASVPDGLRALGHELLETAPRGAGLRLRVRRGAAARSDAPLTRDELLRYARQVVLPEVGEAGQRRLLAGAVAVGGRGPTARTADVYLRAAGVGRVTRDDAGTAPHLGVAPEGRARVGLGVRADATGRLGVARTDPAAEPEPDSGPGVQTPVARALGALLADAACRFLVGTDGKWEPPAIVLGGDGTIATRRSPAAHP
jgi:TusA-related sulfurtransferase